MQDIRTIRPTELVNLQNEGGGTNLFDIRAPCEYSAGHALPARNLPTEMITEDKLSKDLGLSKDEPIYFICHSGMRSSFACELATSLGFTAYNVEGGTSEWKRLGLPIEQN
jgi:rhodanese-related sulfurtransferase